MALVPFPIYKIPPQLFNGEVPQDNPVVFPVVVNEHCALIFSVKKKEQYLMLK
jgi:hypothetical protein